MFFKSSVTSVEIMTNITTCRVKNSVDNKFMTISTKWGEDYMEILIIREGEEPLQGHMPIKRLLESAKIFRQTEDEYLKEIKSELAGRDLKISFSLKDDVFHWKKNVWKRGLIKGEPIKDIVSFSSLVANAMTGCANIEEATSSLKEENEILRKKAAEMEEILKEMIESKKNIEEELYKKFLILLNSKKRKYRELKAKLPKSPTIYDQSTDVSEDDEESQNSDSKKAKTKELSDSQDSVNNNSTCVNIFKNINMAIEEQCQIRENHNMSYDSDESFVLKFSPSPPRHEIRTNDREEEPEDDLLSD